MPTLSEQTIPVVDLKDFLQGTRSERERFVKTAGDALVDIGFFALENHGVDPELIRDAYATAEQFFDLPLETKQHYEERALKGQRGYTSYGREHAKDHAAPDLKEFWHVGREFETGSALARMYPPNFWVREIAQFKPVFLGLFEKLETCAMHLLDACSLYIDQDERTLRQMAENGNSILRIIHYPPIPEETNPASMRAAAHEDINFITLLCESTADGLELLQRDGKWRPIRSLKGQIIVDSGDMLQNITNGYFKSTTHRVVNPDNDRERRFSMPFFVHPRPEVDLSPLPSAVDRTGRKKLYPEVTAEQYLNQRLAEIGLM